jgi:hypothetical protein
MTLRSLFVTSPVLLLLLSCATTPAGEVHRAAPALAPGVLGGVVWMKNWDYTYWTASWTADAVTAGPSGYAANGYFQRAPDGKWKTGVDLVEVTDNQIKARNTNVTFARVEGGFRLTGLYGGQNVDLVIDEKGARAQQTKYVRDASGAYVDPELPQRCFFLVGEAARLDAPPWPEVALALLAANFGVKQWW